MFLSIILPAYNEEKRLLISMEQLRKQLTSILTNIAEVLGDEVDVFEIIIVNDGSTDQTSSIVRAYINNFPDFDLKLIELSQNQGKGYAVKMGVEAARGKYIAFMDADLSTPPTELPKLITAIQKDCAIAIGSRGLPQSEIIEHQPLYRELMGKAFNTLVRLLVINGIHDTQCGFKVFRTHEAKQIFRLLQTARFGFDVEILVIAQELGIPIREIPITWYNSAHSSVSPFRDSWEMFYSLLAMKRQVRRNILTNSLEKSILHGN
ncbi:dolichyl-phosphate beta-glucosyltransferase [Pseudanabaena mucicola]|uniref:dolichyl-phosphate beta-glucosyltransferase n=1 Tax=Pseudanabaena mucicola FACHB-723 TaxID=2692860 RepID=A0ABR7ZYM0_9CYAN|nr:dolichyl-phosphate beta-glucosyltransferase [Pseudanabaena mucicola]MBD2188944.1 glycosyltransferase family 2 protein [Pseudanabaena mucicola FACHB-723]